MPNVNTIAPTFHSLMAILRMEKTINNTPMKKDAIIIINIFSPLLKDAFTNPTLVMNVLLYKNHVLTIVFVT